MYTSIPKAIAALHDNGYDVPRRTFYHHVNIGLIGVEKNRTGKVTGIDHKALIKYAEAHLVKKAALIEMTEVLDDRARLLKAQADKIETDNKIKMGLYVLLSDEERRDAQILSAIKQGVENFGRHIIQQLILRSGEFIGHDCRIKMAQMTPELLAYYNDQAQDLFDRFAQAGEI